MLLKVELVLVVMILLKVVMLLDEKVRGVVCVVVLVKFRVIVMVEVVRSFFMGLIFRDVVINEEDCVWCFLFK